MNNFIRMIQIYLVRSLTIFGIVIPPIPTVSCVFENERKILMINLSYNKGYALPGGGIQSNETVEEALLRECQEELGVKPKSIAYFNSSYTTKEGLPRIHIAFTGNIYLLYLKPMDEGVPEWLSLNEAIERCAYKDQQKILELYKSSRVLNA